MSDPHPNHSPKPGSKKRPTRFDRRHLVLLLAALACIAGLVLWVAELDVGLDSGLSPQNASPQIPATPAK
jgi:hypothetical protein